MEKDEDPAGPPTGKHYMITLRRVFNDHDRWFDEHGDVYKAQIGNSARRYRMPGAGVKLTSGPCCSAFSRSLITRRPNAYPWIRMK